MPATDRTQDGEASRSAQADEASDSEPAYSSRAHLIDPHEAAEGQTYRAADCVTFVVGMGHDFPVHPEVEVVPTFDPERCPEPGPRPSRVTNLDGDDRKRYGETADRGPSNPRAYWYADMAADYAGPGRHRLRRCIALGHSDEMRHAAHSTVVGIDPRNPGVVV